MLINSISTALGAEVTNIDLAKISRNEFQTLYEAWLEHCVLVVRQQSLTEKSLVDFSRLLGELEPPPAGEIRVAGDGGASSPEIWTISNVKVDGQPIGALGNLEADWHSDMSYRPDPPAASILYAREIPLTGANTYFSNMYTAWNELSDDLKTRVAPLQIHHDSAYTSVGTLRAGVIGAEDIAQHGAVHPTTLLHPETGKPTLFLGRRLNAYFMKMEKNDSDKLLDEVWEHCCDQRFVYKHVWQLGDLVIWDNRCTLHRRDAFDDNERRVMWRTQIKTTKAA